MRRREFILSSAAGLAAKPRLDFSAVPNFCSHEHWGSIPSIGSVAEGFRADVEAGARPRGPTRLLDLIIDPYFRGWMTAGGAAHDFAALLKMTSWDAWTALRPTIERHEYTGVYQCTRRGILQLYGVDISRLDAKLLAKLDRDIGEHYSRHLAWYRTAMHKAHFSELIRPVHPEFYTRQESPQSAEEELKFTHTVMRVDPLLDLWRADSARRKSLSELAGVEPVDAKSWRAFLAKIFDLAASKAAVGTKQLQAYRRPLEFLPREDSEVKWTGDLSAAEQRVLQDWVIHECCVQAHERGWPHQVHVGTNNIGESGPLPLIPLARRYPKMKIVMIHCWPFLKEAGWLAKFLPNVYIDTCWQPVLNPEFFREAINMWWNYVPLHKITCGHDSTSVEMAAGSALFTREILAEVLEARTNTMGATGDGLRRAVTALLHNNAVAIYGVGRVA